MVSPLNSDYTIDVEAVQRVVDSLVDNKCAPFILGTTGEAASFSSSQKLDLVKETVKAVNGRIEVYAGISGTSLYESIEQAKAYRDLGVSAMVTTLPYYYPIAADEMERFFTQLADGIKCPLILYNMPAMVGESIPLEVTERLSKHPYIVGMKDSERDIARIDREIELWKDREDFSFYLGWAAQSAHALLKGAHGIVPSTANFVPELYQRLYEAAVVGNADEANQLQQMTNELSLIYQNDRKLNTSLPALKVLMSEYGLCQPIAMPPMYEIPQDEQERLKNELRHTVEKLRLSV